MKNGFPKYTKIDFCTTQNFRPPLNEFPQLNEYHNQNIEEAGGKTIPLIKALRLYVSLHNIPF